MFLNFLGEPRAAMITMAALVLTATPATAQTIGGAWRVDGERVTVVPARISLPIHVADISLTKTAEFSQKGKGVDNIAQYRSADGVVLGTVYVYFAAYADAALAAWATDSAIRSEMGSKLAVASDTTVLVGGVTSAGIRRIYAGGEFTAGQPLSSIGGWVRAGRWMVVLRVTGPAARSAEVQRDFDALLASLNFDGDNKPTPASPLRIAAPCPGDERKAKLLGVNKDTGSQILAGTLISGSMMPSDKNKQPFPLSFPANGAKPVCVRGMIGTRPIFQPANTADGRIVLTPIDDAGGTLTVEPQIVGKGYQVKRFGIGTVEVLGNFDAVPNAAQLGSIIDRTDQQGSAVRARATFRPEGGSNIDIDPAYMKK